MMTQQNARRLVPFLGALTAAFAISTAAVRPALAQGPAPGQGGQPSPAQQQQMMQKAMEQQRSMLKNEFGFSDTQISQYQTKQKKILAGFQAKIDALRKQYGEKPTPTQQQEIRKKLQPAMAKLTQDMQGALFGVATPAQKKKIQAKMAEARQKMQSGGGGGNAMPRPGR